MHEVGHIGFDVYIGSVPFLVSPFMHKFRTLVSQKRVVEKASLV